MEFPYIAIVTRQQNVAGIIKGARFRAIYLVFSIRNQGIFDKVLRRFGRVNS
jgi:hypothetical protein